MDTVYTARGVLVILTTVYCLERPEQVHLSYGDAADQMVVMWSTGDDVHSAVHYGEVQDELTEKQNSTVHRMDWQAKQFLHRAVIKQLRVSTKYYYRVVSSDKTTNASTPVFSFTTIDMNTARRASFLVYGDMGVNASVTFSRLQQEVDTGQYESILHVGDFAYDMHSNGGLTGDLFMRNIENISANIPYMTSPGNHEIESFESFLHYRTRFSTPGTPWPIPLDSLWYSYNVGPVHFISYSTEVYFVHNQADVCQQFNWLQQDLIKANQNRTQQPWVVAMGHRPMYCSNSDRDDCTENFTAGRVRHGLEDLFHAEGVDLIIEAHEHSYERLYPMYKGQLISTDYINLTTPVHVISGAAGSREGNDAILAKPKSWSAFRHSINGDNTYGRLVVHNTTHLYWDQVRVTNGDVIDSMWIVQYNHGAFVKNVNCTGYKKHLSCVCPTPFPYITVAVCVLVVIVLMVAAAIFLCLRYRSRRKRIMDYRKLAVFHEEERISYKCTKDLSDVLCVS